MDRKLIDSLPPIMREIKEIQALAGTEQAELEILLENIEQTLKEAFLDDMGVVGIKRWESLLKAIPKATDTLEERKFRIKALLKKDLPYTVKSLKKKLAEICGADGYFVECENTNYTVRVKLALTSKSNYGEVEQLLMRTIPANLIIDLSLMYNQYKKYENRTYGELELYTMHQLREEVIT